ncbi:MAG: hypothetical protein JJD92_04475 [Frankiaceae bacterium]|nr:hypothetical protein [Frankiaceae bacterium]
MNDVKRLARWDGWCDPCEIERPLILTETGRGLRAWLRGTGREDRLLTLICGVCGEWQAVPYDEPDVPESELHPRAPIAATQPVGVHQIVLCSVESTAYPIEPSTPGPRTPPPIRTDEFTLALVSAGLDLVSAGRR